MRYKGASKKFVTWTITGETPALSANDEDLCSICSLDIDIFSEGNYDPFNVDFWLDGGLRTVRDLVSLIEAGKVLEEQYRLLNVELLSTTQRVNLFEKVKIPECLENIRKIQIYLGDATTAAVVRSKIAKRKMQEAAA